MPSLLDLTDLPAQWQIVVESDGDTPVKIAIDQQAIISIKNHQIIAESLVSELTKRADNVFNKVVKEEKLEKIFEQAQLLTVNNHSIQCSYASRAEYLFFQALVSFEGQVSFVTYEATTSDINDLRWHRLKFLACLNYICGL